MVLPPTCDLLVIQRPERGANPYGRSGGVPVRFRPRGNSDRAQCWLGVGHVVNDHGAVFQEEGGVLFRDVPHERIHAVDRVNIVLALIGQHGRAGVVPSLLAARLSPTGVSPFLKRFNAQPMRPLFGLKAPSAFESREERR